MKKLTLIAMAALLLVCTQCKKNETTDAKIIQITFTPTDNGAKTGFNPDGTFSWSENECIFVGGPDGCIGTLTGTAIDGNITFTGDITVPNHGDMLHFFYLGNNKDGSVIPTELDFSAQNGQDVTNFHVACCSQEYITGNTDFGGTLDVLVSFAYIDLSAFVDANGAQEVVYLHGADVFSKATVNYSEGTITGTNGYISLGRAINGGGYYALIPQTTPSSTTVKFDSNTKTGTMNFLRGIETAKLYRHSDQSALAPEMGELRANAGGLFSVSDTKMVRIAQSNLQYTRTSTTQSWANGTWSFMEHPWSYVEYIPADNTTWTVSEEYENETAIGLFGWGTSGKGNMSDYGAYYYPWATAVNTTQEGGLYYGPKNRDKNLTDEYANGDWGIYNNPGGELPS